MRRRQYERKPAEEHIQAQDERILQQAMSGRRLQVAEYLTKVYYDFILEDTTRGVPVVGCSSTYQHILGKTETRAKQDFILR
jgi:hypothetical protein